MDCYIGTDPGARGAYCALTPDLNLATFIDAKRPVLEIYNWIIQLEHAYAIQKICIEDVKSQYGMSAASNFTYGGAVQTPHVLFELRQLPVTLVRPKVWQKVAGVTTKGKELKQEVAQICVRNYPLLENQLHGPKGGLLDGRSDALMIAHYSYLLHTGKI